MYYNAYDNFCVTKIQHIMYIDKDYSIIYNDIYNYSVHPAICEGWHVTHMLKTPLSEQFQN
jgi:uncharacterized protein YbdZ (MbtH family)